MAVVGAFARRLQQQLCRRHQRDLLLAAQHHLIQQDHQQLQHHPWFHHQHQHSRALHLTSAAATPNSRDLAHIVKLELLAGKSADEVEEIWMQHHAASTKFIGSVLSQEEHLVMCARAAASPLFVLPVAKGGGAGRFQTMLLQWEPPKALLITLLEEYKTQGPAAPPRLAVRFYSELAEATGLVLARGEVLSPHVVSAAEVRSRRN